MIAVANTITPNPNIANSPGFNNRSTWSPSPTSSLSTKATPASIWSASDDASLKSLQYLVRLVDGASMFGKKNSM